VKNGSGKKQTEKGVAMVEAGLVLPIVFLLFFGFVQFAMVLSGWNSATYGCRAATRYAIVHGSTAPSSATVADLQNIVKKNAFMVTGGNLVVTPTWPSGNSPGNPVTVSASLTFHVFIPFVQFTVLTVSTSSTMTIVQ
jgi:Flp pilus assembly protein TadG